MRAHFTPQAEIDLEEVGDYIALDNPGRAVSFIREIRQHCEKIAGGPDHYAARPDLGDTIRICAHGNYLIVFEPFEIRYPGLAKGPVEAGAGMDGLARDAARCRWPAGCRMRRPRSRIAPRALFRRSNGKLPCCAGVRGAASDPLESGRAATDRVYILSTSARSRALISAAGRCAL